MQLPSPSQKKFFAEAADSYQQQLRSDTAVHQYLASRGIGPQGAATFRLGVVREPLVGHENFRGRLAIPYITDPGGIVNFSFRCLRDHKCSETVLGQDHKGHDIHCQKYLAPMIDRTVFNVAALETDSDELHMTEGELDAITLTLAGYPAIGIPGVSNWKPFFKLVVADYEDKFVWSDGDAAGRKFAKFLEKEIGARRVPVPAGEDVNAVYLRAGAEGLHALAGR